LYHNDGQWTYEFCYKRSVRQFRQEAHGEGIEEFTCGRYKGDEQQEEAVLVRFSAQNTAGVRGCAAAGGDDSPPGV
jgi:uncharacterized protein (UPF0264 family)